MSNKEVIEQLRSLKVHCESMKESGEEWERDVQALEYAIEELEGTAQEAEENPKSMIIEILEEQLDLLQYKQKTHSHNIEVLITISIAIVRTIETIRLIKKEALLYSE